MNQSQQPSPDFSRLTDAELIQQIADLQSTVNAMLAEITRRLGSQQMPMAIPIDPAQESTRKNNTWGGIINQDEKGRARKS